MALEDVVEEILSQARKESERIVEEGKREAEAIAGAAKREAEKKREQFERETGLLTEEARKTQESTLNLRLEKMSLRAKKEVVDDVFSKLAERMKKMGSNERERLINRMMSKAGKEIKVASVYSNENDARFILKSNEVELGGTIDTIGGIIAEDKRGEVRVNYTFETLLERLKEMFSSETAKKVFQ